MNRREDNYWEQKIRIFLHDPMDKALRIQGHEDRATDIADALGVSTPSKSEVGLFDIIAAGLDRANLPKYSPNPSRNGAVDFAQLPWITHPIAGGGLKFTGQYDSAQQTTQQIVELLRRDTDNTAKRWDKQTFFNYLFFVLRKRVIATNCGNLGFLWDKIPADSRIPDHSIWNHAGMVSALYTSFTESRSHGASMVVVSLSPVQPFIGKTRKLRDHWVASVILSWLTFEGICSVMEQLGPDHILYPSLQDQPLVEAFLTKDFQGFFQEFRQVSGVVRDETVASFPNKMVFIAPAGQEEQFADEIEARIRKHWKDFAGIVLTWMGDEEERLSHIFNRQIDNFWQFSWSSAHLVSLDHLNEINQLFEEDKFAKIFETIEKFSQNYPNARYAYPITHSLVQTVMAAGKSVPFTNRAPEPGIKCPVCGEFEILHGVSTEEYQPHEYKKVADRFWRRLSNRVGSTLVKEDEQLCSICAIKRFAPHALEKYAKDHLLRTIFKDGRFPSTTEMATVEFREKLRQKGLLPEYGSSSERDKLEEQLIDELHEKGDLNSEDGGKSRYGESVQNLLRRAEEHDIIQGEEDSYYAILMMDGDKMGDLVNGTTIGARWRDVLHPRLVDGYDTGTLKAQAGLWKDYLDKQRILSPALHATLSESLGVFSLYVVPDIIRRCRGKLIYAGGDDVAAVLPLSRVFDAAQQIQQAYNMRFATISHTGVEELQGETEGTTPVFLLPGKAVSLQQGKKQRISISAAIVLCHHKQPLRGALEEAHDILDNVAKKRKGRNAVAVRLKKRSGHQRDFAAQWSEINPFFPKGKTTIVESFFAVQEAYGQGDLSGSLIYRFPELSVMVKSVLQNSENCSEKKQDQILCKDQVEQIIRIFACEISHSGNLMQNYPGEGRQALKQAVAVKLAAHIAGITIYWDRSAHKGRGVWQYNGEVPVIARYLSRGGATS